MKFRINDRAEHTSATTGGGDKRFSAALAVSLMVNILFLIGAGTLLRTNIEPNAQVESTDYITLDRISVPAPAKRSTQPVLAKASRRPIPVPFPSRSKRPVLQPVRVLPSAQSSPVAVAAREADVPEVVPDREPVATFAKDEIAQTPSAPTNGGEADVASSSVLPGEPVSSPPAPQVSAPPPTPGTSPAPKIAPATDVVSELVGITKSAELAYKELPQLPDEIQASGYRSFVRVKVEVAEDGKFTVAISTSSGNPDVDQRVLDALKRWKWKPALKHGVPITSTEIYRFDFDVD